MKRGPQFFQKRSRTYRPLAKSYRAAIADNDQILSGFTPVELNAFLTEWKNAMDDPTQGKKITAEQANKLFNSSFDDTGISVFVNLKDGKSTLDLLLETFGPPPSRRMQHLRQLKRSYPASE
jgi:ribosome modulation factor